MTKELRIIDLTINKEFKINVPSHIVHVDKFLEVQDFSFFQTVFKDRPSDIDLAFEYCGHVLIIEFKRIGAFIKNGQDRLFFALASNANIKVLLITGELDKDLIFNVQKITKDGVTKEHAFTLNLLKRWLVKWMQDCEKSPIDIDIPNAENLKVYKKRRPPKFDGVRV